MISDALSHPAVNAVVVSNEAGNGFNTIAQPGDPGDGAIMGGVGYIVIASAMPQAYRWSAWLGTTAA